MQRPIFFSLIAISLFILGNVSARAEGLSDSESHFTYRTHSGGFESVRIIHTYRRFPIVHPFAHLDPRLDSRLARAATIAQDRAYAKSKARCWHFVKNALLASGVINSFPKTNYAYEAGNELVRDYGFKKLAVRDPYAAPIGSVCVYAHGSSGAGHVEIRTKDGFVSDYRAKNKCRYPLLAIYGKYSS